jgi:hypothetical protein
MSMKTKTILIAALFIFGAVVSTIANDPGDEHGLAVIPVEGSEVYKVIYDGVKEGRVKLNIYNEKSSLIFSQTMVAKGFIQPLNFKGLKAGKYTVEVVNGEAKKSERIDFAPENSPSSYIHVTKIANEEGKYLVSIVRKKDADERITLKIFQKDALIHNETNDLSADFARIYDVKASGPLTFEIQDKNGNVTTTYF